eukprot:SAG11_NODE_163_length_13928_cov_29.869188_8_plen_166_part_00
MQAQQGDREAKASELLAAVEGGDGKTIELNAVDIVTPHGVALATGVDVTVKEGNSLMVTGRNATGKTSFVRVLSGNRDASSPFAGTFPTPTCATAQIMEGPLGSCRRDQVFGTWRLGGSSGRALMPPPSWASCPRSQSCLWCRSAFIWFSVSSAWIAGTHCAVHG